MEMWMRNVSGKSILETTGLDAAQARRLVERALTRGVDGRIAGFWPCVSTYQRPATRAFSKSTEVAERQTCKTRGALNVFFSVHSDIERSMKIFVKSRRTEDTVPVAIVTASIAHSVFIALCRKKELHLDETKWPFNCKRRGQEAIRIWLAREQAKNPAKGTLNSQGDEAGSLTALDMRSMGRTKFGEPFLAYERVELDEQYIDAVFEIVWQAGDEGWRSVTTTRLWLLALVDCGSHAILSTSISFGERYSTDDVLHLLRRALCPPPRRKLALENANFQYRSEAAYPGELKEFELNRWQVLALDSDAVHKSGRLSDVVEKVFGCKLVNEMIGTPTERHSVEGLFSVCAKMLLASPSATGSSPDSSARRNPEEAAKKYTIVAPLAVEIMDVFARNRNATALSSNGGHSPLEVLQAKYLQSQVFLNRLDTYGPAQLWRLLPVHAAKLSRTRNTRKKIGAISVVLAGARYYSVDMANDARLQYADNLDVHVYVEEDARFATIVPLAYQDAAYKAAIGGRLSGLPHTLEWRRAYYASSRNANIASNADGPQLMFGFIEKLAEAGKTDDPAAALLNGVVAFMQDYGVDAVAHLNSNAVERKSMLGYSDTTCQEEHSDVESGLDLEPNNGSLTSPSLGSAPASDSAPTPTPAPAPSSAPTPSLAPAPAPAGNPPPVSAPPQQDAPHSDARNPPPDPFKFL